MDAERKDIIKKTINDLFSFQEKVSDFKLQNDIDLHLAQLDFFKVISSIVIGIIGIGYFYSQNLDKDFLLMSLLFSIIVLVFSISYTRESIDRQSSGTQKIYEMVSDETNNGVKICVEAIKKDKADIFFDYAEDRADRQHDLTPKLTYTGEAVVFLFYLSIGLLGLSFFAKNYHFSFFSVQTLILFVCAYLLSFNNWAMKFSEFFSKKLFESKK